MYDSLNYCVSRACQLAWGWPLIGFFLLVGIAATVASGFAQFRYLFKSFKLVLAPQDMDQKNAQMSSLQAFLNALSTSMGNGAIAGIATAVFDGGPGAVFWVLFTGLFTMPIRYCEVFLSNIFEQRKEDAVGVGPMRYLNHVPGGWFLPTFYAFFCLLLSFTSGNAAQSNSIRLSIQMVAQWVPTYLISAIVFLFMVYVFAGGAQRVIKISERIVPIKVVVFFVSAIAIFFYHWSDIVYAAKLILDNAFTFKAIKGAIVGKTMQEAIRFGMSRTINATESGLGVAGIFFGSTGSKEPVEEGIMSMSTVFISNFLVAGVVGFLIVLSGAWSSGLTSTPLTIAAYSTVFGYLGSYIVAFLSIIFGIGVLVAYGFVGRECWLYLTGGRYIKTYNVMYTFIALWGTIAEVDIIWNSVDLVNAGLLVVNLYGILVLLPVIRKGMKSYKLKNA